MNGEVDHTERGQRLLLEHQLAFGQTHIVQYLTTHFFELYLQVPGSMKLKIPPDGELLLDMDSVDDLGAIEAFEFHSVRFETVYSSVAQSTNLAVMLYTNGYAYAAVSVLHEYFQQIAHEEAG